MKFIFITLLVLSSPLFAADKDNKGPRYRHIQDKDGKIMATIDSKDNSVEYKADPKLVVKELIGLIQLVTTQCNQQIDALKNPPKPQQVK